MASYRAGKCLLPNLIRSRKLTPQELADRIPMSKQQISDYSNNRKLMSLETAKTIATALNVSIEELYEWVERDR